MIHLDYRDARPIYAQIMDGYREQIVTGVLQPGDRLPSVRELASRLAINPNTIQRAYRELEQQGVIETLPGKGCFVRGGAAAPDWGKLEGAVAQLLAQGISREEILKHIGGMQDA